jgi:predicted GNAT family N-acyltransferase
MKNKNSDYLRPTTYLNNMVMQEAQRGKGLGSKLLQQEMGSIKQDDKNAVFALSTQRISTTRL